MVKFRDLVNPNILNREWENFIGDSEYINNKGELKMGTWYLYQLYDGWLSDGEYSQLDDEVDEEKLDGEYYVELFNDNGNLCGVVFNY